MEAAATGRRCDANVPSAPLEAWAAVGAVVRFAQAACLNSARPDLKCELCISKCPVGSLSQCEAKIVANDGCYGCGQCAAACPTGAIEVDGFDMSFANSWPEPEIALHCARVPQPDRTPGAIVIPCLSGISVNHMLAAMAANQDRTIVLVDHGLCATCRVGGVDEPWSETLAQTRRLARECGVPEERLPHVRRVSATRTLPLQPIPRRPTTISRRNLFLGELATRQTAASAPRDRRRRTSVPARAERLDALAKLATRWGGSISATEWPSIAIGSACHHHGVCASVCAPGALSIYIDGDATGLAFDSRRCISCGECVWSCPEQAIALAHHLQPTRFTGPSRLTRTPMAICEDCDGSFAPQPGEAVCPSCQKTRALASEAFALAMRARDSTRRLNESAAVPPPKGGRS